MTTSDGSCGVCVLGLRRARLRDCLDAPPDTSPWTHDRRGQHGHRRVHGRAGIGGALGGRIASRLSRRQALWTYVLLELVVAVAALSIAGSLTLLTPVFAWAYGEAGAGPLFSTVRIASSFGVSWCRASRLVPRFPWPFASPSHRLRDRAGRRAGSTAPTRPARRPARSRQVSSSSRSWASRVRH